MSHSPSIPNLIILLALVTLGLSSCSVLLDFNECTTNTDCSEGTQCIEGICEAPSDKIVKVSGVISGDVRWTADTVYILQNVVTILPSATLTIEPGTLIKGIRNSALVARSGAKLIAEGTRENPIVFTSAKPVGERLAGDWGGIAMLGQAKVNRDNFQLNILTEESDALFGGNDDTWNCGSLQYVRIEFGGGKVKGEEALNGLTLGGCGTKTKISHVQIHFGEDDGLELFGGTVDLRYVLVSRSQDDGIDIDTGWRGTGQFIAVIQDAAGDNAIEVDNLREDNTKTPLTNFTIYNYTLIGSHQMGNQRGITFKEGGIGMLSHGIIMGHTLEAIDIFGAVSGDLGKMDKIVIKNTVFHQIGQNDTHYFPLTNEPNEINFDDPTDMVNGDDNGFEEDIFFREPRFENVFGEDPQIISPYNLKNPTFKPTKIELVTGAMIPTPPTPFSATANYLGAFAPDADPWTEDWTAFPEF